MFVRLVSQEKTNKGQATVFESHIQEHTPRYYPDIKLGQTVIKFMGVQERMASTLFRYRISDTSQSHSILVKVPTSQNLLEAANGISVKPLRLFPRTDPETMHRLEYSALRGIEEYYDQINLQSLGTVHILDYLPEYRAILMEEVGYPSLRQLYLRENRLQDFFNKRNLCPAYRNAGVWLRLFHAMPEQAYVKERHISRDTFIESVNKLANFLGNLLCERQFFHKLSEIVRERACFVLPEFLTLGVGHGDFAMRNILIGPGTRVTVFDTFAKWRVPIYEDIGYFLNGLWMSRPQVISQGLAFSSQKLLAFEKAFLSGYFEGQAIPIIAIRLYELLALLDKWVSTQTNLQSSKTMMSRVSGRFTARMVKGYFRGRAKALLQDISQKEMAFLYER